MKLSAAYAEILAHDRLPSPNAVARAVLRMTRDPKTDVAAIGTVIATDPAICSRILRAVNAPTAGVRRRVTSIEQAVTVLGFRAVAGIAVAFSLLDSNRSGLPEFDYDGHWLHSVAQAVTVRVLAAHTRIAPAGEGFTYGLLANIGRLALITVYPERYRQVLLTLGGSVPAELGDAERVVFDIDAETLSAYMMREWGLPACWDAIADSAGHAGGGAGAASPRSMALLRTCRVAARVASVLVAPSIHRDQVGVMIHDLAELGIDTELMVWLGKDIAAGLTDAGAALQLPLRRSPALADVFSRAVDGP